MKTGVKRFLALAVAVLMTAAFLGGCGKKDEDKKDGSSENAGASGYSKTKR